MMHVSMIYHIIIYNIHIYIYIIILYYHHGISTGCCDSLVGHVPLWTVGSKTRDAIGASLYFDA